MWGDVVVDLDDVVSIVKPEAEGEEDSEEDSEGSDGEGDEEEYDDNG